METVLGGGEGTCVGDCTQTPGYYGDAGEAQNKKCKKCAAGQKPNTAGDKCFSCPDENCERCDSENKCARCNNGEPPADGACPVAGKGCHSSCDGCTEDAMTNQANKCTGCKEGLYLKPEPTDGQSGTCLTAADCTSDQTHFTKEKAGDSKKMCLPCNDATHGITDCKKCTLKTLSEGAEPIVVCSECADKWLTPPGNACLESCPAGTHVDNVNGVSVCTPCHDTCAECNGNADAASCTACYPGYSLLYGSGIAGTCVKECTGEFGANCADGQCTADIGGAKYCAQCKDGYAPIDGICTAVTPAGRASVCTAAGGKCTACTGDYALMSGGCYGVAKLPGKSICTLASNGKCTMCAANKQAPIQEKCPECSEGCAKCADSNACTECYSGYYKGAGNKCFKCTSGDNAVNNPITGVADCISCAPPTGGNGGPVTCYVKADGTSGGDDGTGGSTNKSGLSTGAIAGIAVAVVIVVGGLVGFLCWWFICRGKA
ncbi:VSP [Giardia lamblia P15]|uniref:VSP n=1 Tax=Giardia intestinalis (strain P15) TaxID=658858 RepID=E1F0C0_GIAIA|nr:VSP [Giardia lamblia P15]